MKDIIKVFMAEELQSFFEGRLSKQDQLKKDLEKENFGEKDSLFKEAAKLLQAKTSSKQKIPGGGNEFTIEDIMFVLKALKDDSEFMANITSAKQLADDALQVCHDVIEIANAFVKRERLETGYKSKLAYEVENRNELIAAIKTALKAIYALTKKRIKLETSEEAQTLTVRKVTNYITSKALDISNDLKSIESGSNADNPKDKALSTSNMKNLEAQFGKNPAANINKAFEIVKKYSGSESLTWPTLKIKIESGDEYKSLFQYLDAYGKGQDKGHADNLIAQYKNKAKAEIKKAILTNDDFRHRLKIAALSNDIDITPGSEQTISKLQSVAKQFMKRNPNDVAELHKEGIKATAIDEIVGLLSTFIQNGKYYDVQVK